MPPADSLVLESEVLLYAAATLVRTGIIIDCGKIASQATFMINVACHGIIACPNM